MSADTDIKGEPIKRDFLAELEVDQRVRVYYKDDLEPHEVTGSITGFEHYPPNRSAIHIHAGTAKYRVKRGGAVSCQVEPGGPFLAEGTRASLEVLTDE